jgi:hypothetical protein
LAALRLPVVSAIRTNRTGEADVTESSALVRAGTVHQAGFEGQGTYVAVLDTGVDQAGYEQFFPAGSVAEAYRAKDSSRGDADGSATPAGHGTHVASTVLAMAPATRILSIEVFKMVRIEEGDDRGKLKPLWSPGRLNDGIRHVVDLKRQYLRDPTQCCNIVAMNLSLGRAGSHFETACTDDFGFRLAWEAGIIPVTSAGNGALVKDPTNPDRRVFKPGIGDPACNPYALNVGATTDGAFAEYVRQENGEVVEYCEPSTVADRPTSFSQTGALLRILAPGNCIVAAKGSKQGTSMAAPHVAGAVAALVSAKPTATGAEIWEALTLNGQPVQDTRTTPSTGSNRLDMAASLQALLGDVTPQVTPGPPIGGMRGVAVEPPSISPDEGLRPGQRYTLDRIGIWNTGTGTSTYELVVAETGVDVAEVAPASWFEFDQGTVTVGPGELVLVRPDLEVPSSATAGAYSAVIRAIDAELPESPSDGVVVTFEIRADAPDGGGGGLWLLLIAGAVVAGIWFMRRRSRSTTTP